MSSSPVAEGEEDRNKLAGERELLEVLQAYFEMEAANLKKVLHSLAAIKSSTGVLAPATSAVLTTALQSACSTKHSIKKAKEQFFGQSFASNLGICEKAWASLNGNPILGKRNPFLDFRGKIEAWWKRIDGLVEYVDRDMPLLLHQAIAAVIKITNVAGKQILEFPFGDVEWRECIRFRYAYAADVFEVLYLQYVPVLSLQ